MKAYTPSTNGNLRKEERIQQDCRGHQRKIEALILKVDTSGIVFIENCRLGAGLLIIFNCKEVLIDGAHYIKRIKNVTANKNYFCKIIFKYCICKHPNRCPLIV
jgi:hypothetical protein